MYETYADHALVIMVRCQWGVLLLNKMTLYCAIDTNQGKQTGDFLFIRITIDKVVAVM